MLWDDELLTRSNRRRYVIRLRVEADQFLLSCVELGTFVRWLDKIYAAIDIAPPLDERGFPRDQSIPRIQRIRWLRGHGPRPADDNSGFPRFEERPQSVDADSEHPLDDTSPTTTLPDGGSVAVRRNDNSWMRHPPERSLSTTSFPNEHLDPDTGKWRPYHKWTDTHDQLYAKLCYSVLLFKSPRKSNYIVTRGRRWYVDWGSGRMVRVLPPSYSEVELWGPWQVIEPENRLI